MGHRRTLLGIAAAAVAIRCGVWLVALFALHVPAERIPAMRDGSGFLSYAAAIRDGAGGFERLATYDRRAFPGYPLLLAALNAPRWPWIALALNAAAAALAAGLTFLIYKDARVGLAMAFLTPSYLLYSTTVMSEAAVLCVGLAAFYAGLRGRAAVSGVLFGCTAILRPLAAPIGLAYLIAKRRRIREITVCMALALLLVGGAMLWMRWWAGSVTSGISAFAQEERAYKGDGIFSWPFHSLVSVPLHTAVPIWKIAYIWAHVLFALGGLALLLREKPRQEAAIAWLASNTLICLSIGGIWGFHEFHRFIIPGLPPLFYAWRRFLPGSVLGWIVLAAFSAAVAARGLGHGW